MKKIVLSNGNFTHVDNGDFDFLSRFNWHYHTGYARAVVWITSNGIMPCENLKTMAKRIIRDKQGRIVTTIREHGGASKNILMHRLLLNAPSTLEVDHINMNRLDNRRKNLRLATHSDNQHNRKKYKVNTSGYKGVYFYKDRKKWSAKIRIKGKLFNLGFFDSPYLASFAYNTEATKNFGDYARPNFMPSL